MNNPKANNNIKKKKKKKKKGGLPLGTLRASKIRWFQYNSFDIIITYKLLNHWKMQQYKWINTDLHLTSYHLLYALRIYFTLLDLRISRKKKTKQNKTKQNKKNKTKIQNKKQTNKQKKN